MKTAKKEMGYDELLYGEKKELVIPSGYKVTIREQNGHDDDLLSDPETSKTFNNLNIFLSSLIIDTNLPISSGNGKLSSTDIDKMLIRDKYFILIASRIHSTSPILNFSFDWGEESGGEQKYTEDLENFIWDYSKPLEEDDEFLEQRIKPYGPNPFEKQELTLKSGKQLRYKIFDTACEKTQLGAEKVTRNSELLAREIELLMENKWVKIENFVFFTKRDMIEINHDVDKVDPAFTGTTKIHNPKSGETINFPILNTGNFFYPEEI